MKTLERQLLQLVRPTAVGAASTAVVAVYRAKKKRVAVGGYVVLSILAYYILTDFGLSLIVFP
jgi:hypothetical protein